MQRVELDTLPVRDQIALVQQARVLVCVHGAGCAHTVFLPRDSVLVHVAPFMVEHDLYARLALAARHRCLEYRAPGIANSVFYSTKFPPACLAAAMARAGLAHAPEPRLARTASGMLGLAGATYAAISPAIRAEPRACRINEYFWKQQDLWIDPQDLAVLIHRALAA